MKQELCVKYMTSTMEGKGAVHGDGFRDLEGRIVREFLKGSPTQMARDVRRKEGWKEKNREGRNEGRKERRKEGSQQLIKWLPRAYLNPALHARERDVVANVVRQSDGSHRVSST